ncbi:MAG: hypothetical protein K2L74_05250 [Muribaculaceae bacterium]|nr:hypothetical protein [Muribaculaceae bacterium]
MKSLTAIMLTCALAAAACGGDGGASPTPRRHAYPRPELYDSCYTQAQQAPVAWAVCCGAVCTADSGGRWLTTDYPLYNARIYITFTPAADSAAIAAAIANRRQRISLNLAGAPATTTHVASADGSFDAALVEAPGTTMPLQFVATDGHSMVVSGAVHTDTAEPYDSVRPTVEALRRDIGVALRNLRRI